MVVEAELERKKLGESGSDVGQEEGKDEGTGTCVRVCVHSVCACA